MKNLFRKAVFILFIISILFSNASMISAQDSDDLNLTADFNGNENIQESDNAYDFNNLQETNTNNNQEKTYTLNYFQETYDFSNLQEKHHSFKDLQDEINKSEDNGYLIINGTYKYDKDIDESNSLIDGIEISKNLTIIGNNCTIDGSNMARCLHIQSNLNIVLENLTIINGYTERDNGGGILTGEYINLTLKNCVFENNEVYNWNGGALSTDKGCYIEICNSTFLNNTSIRKSSLEWNEYKRGMGSAIRSFINSTLNIYDSYFSLNYAFLSTILLITYDDKNPPETSTLHIKNCIFNNNTSKHAGVVYLDEFGQGEVLDSVFSNNTSKESSGTLLLDTCPYSIVKNCTFINNSGKKGAAICIKIFEENLTSNAKITDCRFINNTAYTYGGAIYSYGGIAAIKNCEFESNNGGERGGAIYSHVGLLNVIDCGFESNLATRGGAIYSYDTTTTVKNCEFENNKAYERGGAIYLNSKNSFIINSIILASHAGDKGESIFSTIDCTLSNCKISKIKATNDKNCYGVYNNFKVKVKTKAGKVKTSYKSGGKMKITLIYDKNKYATMNIILKIKVYTGRKSETYYVTTNSKVIAYFKASGFSKGTHKVEITSANSNVQFSKAKTSIKISKAKGKISAPKVANRYKSKSYFKITLKHKSTKKALGGIKMKIKVYTGEKFKTYTKKTNSKGKIFINTKSLNKGNHKVIISSINANIKFSKKSCIAIK